MTQTSGHRPAAGPQPTATQMVPMHPRVEAIRQHYVNHNDEAVQFMARAFEGKNFTQDWFTTKASNLFVVLRDLSFLRILELGAFEGRSTVFFAELFPDSVITSVDVFDSYEGSRFEHFFDRNVAPYADRIRKIKSSTVHAMIADLAGETFDFIYVDAGHGYGEVMIDAILAWRALDVGGIIAFDDYDFVSAEPSKSVRLAINQFIDVVGTAATIQSGDRQVILQKTRALELFQYF